MNNQSVSRNYYYGIALVSLSTLVVEIILTKIFSVTVWYHFAFLAISLAMFGVGFGGLFVYKLQNHFSSFIGNNLFQLSFQIEPLMSRRALNENAEHLITLF